jgi:hypothetical protein
MDGPTLPIISRLFEGQHGLEQARDRIRKGNAHIAIGHNVIRTYLGQGNADRSHRGDRQIRDAMAALQQSGRYADMVDAVLRSHSVAGKPTSKGTQVEAAKPKRPRERILDERTASIFPNEHQFNAFRESVTTPAARKVIDIDQQLALAKSIMDPKARTDFKSKQIGAPYIKLMVQAAVRDGMAKQREIDKAEREAFLREQTEERINAELHVAQASLRSLVSALMKLEKLAEEFPMHPKLGGFSAKLDTLAQAIKQFSTALKPKRQAAE